MMFTGVGAQIESTQALIFDQFDKRTNKVRVCKAEAKIRTWSEIFPNAYFLSIFACNRTVYEDFKIIPIETESNQKAVYLMKIAALENQLKILNANND